MNFSLNRANISARLITYFCTWLPNCLPAEIVNVMTGLNGLPAVIVDVL